MKSSRWFKILYNNEILISFGIVGIAILFGNIVLNPLWINLAIPGLFSEDTLPPITAPVDGIYYILNSKRGYLWSNLDPMSLWYHPLLSFLMQRITGVLPLNYIFWTISTLFAILSLVLIFRLSILFSDDQNISPLLLFTCLLVPGGLIMSTGNAEIPCLFFNAGLLLSVLLWKKWWLTILFATCAILTKPNALYMVPVLMVYIINDINEKDQKIYRHALLGVISILFFWLMWIGFVGWKTQIRDAYWQVRLRQNIILDSGDFFVFYQNLFDAYINDTNIRNKIRYTSALVIPIINIIIIGKIKLKREVHRYAILIGNLCMFSIALIMGNPNKIIVYNTTLPGYFISNILFFSKIKCFKKMVAKERIEFFVYFLYLILCILIFIIGTPLCWYY